MPQRGEATFTERRRERHASSQGALEREAGAMLRLAWRRS